MQRKNPVMQGVPGKLSASGNKNSIRQGAAARSNIATSIGGFPRTPISIKKPKAKGKVSPMDILVAPQLGGR